MNDKNSLTLVHRFVHWESTQPDAVYLTQPAADGQVREYTWKQVGDQARRMAAYLRSLNLPEQSHIGILGKNSAHWIMADLAIWMAGHVSVPMYPTMNAETATYVLEHADVRLLFVGRLDTWNEIRNGIPDSLPLVSLPMAPEVRGHHWDSLVTQFAPLQDLHEPRPGNLATIVYTSGSTGHPKGVMHSFGAMSTYALGAGDFCKATKHERVLSYLPLAHVAERAFVEANSLCHGFHVFFNDRLETFAEDLRRARPTLFISMPRLWTKFYLGVAAKLPLRKQKLLFAIPFVSSRIKKKILTMLGLDAVRIAFTGSAPLPAEIVNWYRNLGLELLDVYGMSENFAYSHYSRPGQVRLGYCGQPLPGVECRIAEDGEILVKAATQMIGYFKQPELTASCMTADGFFKTGDRGEVDEAGRLKITGRVKELFKTSKGKYVAPAPIENKFSHPKVEAVCVTGPGHAQPFALVMLSIDGRKDMEDAEKRESLRAELQGLLDAVNATLEDHEKLHFLVVVKDFWSIDNGFLTPTLKIKRNVIENHYLAKAKKWVDQGMTVILDAD